MKKSQLVNISRKILFERWLRELELFLLSELNVSISELPPLDYEYLFEKKVSPEEACETIGLFVDEIV